MLVVSNVTFIEAIHGATLCMVRLMVLNWTVIPTCSHSPCHMLRGGRTCLYLLLLLLLPVAVCGGLHVCVSMVSHDFDKVIRINTHC